MEHLFSFAGITWRVLLPEGTALPLESVQFPLPLCYVHQEGNEPRELTAGQWIELAREAADRGMVFALLTGGEPFLRRETSAIRMPKECAHCPRRELCPVCAAVCVTETGAFDRVPEYACRQTTQMIGATWREYEQRCKE